MADDAAKSLKLKRRGAKAKLSRSGNEIKLLMDQQRPATEVQESLDKYERAYKDVQDAHDRYSDTIEKDDVFTEEEVWMEECQKTFISLKLNVIDYQAERKEEYETREVKEQQKESKSDKAEPGDKSRCSFQMEKPKLPKFTGDVRDYGVFRSDFMHLVDTRYTKRDAITILRSCLHGRPLDVIRGIGTDYDEAWDQLDAIYGDPRFVADAIVYDLTKFRPLKDGEDSRFCELVHLVRRSYTTLKEVGREEDISNSNMLAMIERKMSADDRKVWFRQQEEKGVATLRDLLDWLNKEMKARMRATAPLINESRHSTISHVTQETKKKPEFETEYYRCWICRTNDHWIDQCKKLTSKPAQERLQMMKQNNACFSCLKKAGRGHRMSTCKRRRQCTEKYNEERCRYFHHPLLHTDEQDENRVRTEQHSQVDVAVIDSDEALLPIVTVDILSKGKSERGNCLLDSGAQISLVRQQVATELQLRGTPTNIIITKIGGGKEILQTQKYRVPIRKIRGYGKPIVITAVGIPLISEDVVAIDLDEMAMMFSLKKQDLQRASGPINILIGINHPRMHGGEVRETKDCCARKSPIGWVVYGATPDEVAHNKAVLHVKLANPVDLTDFWTIKTEKVNAKQCQCADNDLTKQEVQEEQVIRSSARKEGKQWEIAYPWEKEPDLLLNNKILAEKMLLAAEKKLRKNPEHVEAYKSKMKEMTEMGLASKLEKDEVKKGEVNVADKVLRGIAVEKLTDEWKEGPIFLHRDEADCPTDKAVVDHRSASNEEKRKTQSVLTTTETSEVIDCNRISSWRKLLRVTAYVFKFIQTLKAKKGPLEDDKVTPSPSESDRAEKYWLKRAQISLMPRVEQGEFKVLTSFVDEDGVMRVGGRVETLVTSYESKHPALPPASHRISLMITHYMHELGHHGVATTTAKTRRRFWILQGHRLAKTVKYRCVTCRTVECKKEMQTVANLPSCPVAPFSLPFHSPSVT